jgi:putative transposase
MANTKKKRKRSARPKQLEMDFTEKTWGGYRPGSGAKKKPKGEAGVSHSKREELRRGDCATITWKLRDGLPPLRRIDEDHVLRYVLRDAQKSFLRIVHYVVMNNHLHLIVEATDTTSLSKGLNGLGVRIARNLNKLWKRRGSVLKDRFYMNRLHTPGQVRNAIRYVLMNAFRHGAMGLGVPDPHSSAEYFDGWVDCGPIEIWGGSPVVPPQTFNLREGWRRVGGMLSLRKCPASWLRRPVRKG